MFLFIRRRGDDLVEQVASYRSQLLGGRVKSHLLLKMPFLKEKNCLPGMAAAIPVFWYRQGRMQGEGLGVMTLLKDLKKE